MENGAAEIIIQRRPKGDHDEALVPAPETPAFRIDMDDLEYFRPLPVCLN